MAYTDSTFSNPITKVGRVVYNVALDLDHAAYRGRKPKGRMAPVDFCNTTVTPDHLTIQPHELCLEQDPNIFKRGLSRSVNDTEILLLSSLNGLKTQDKNIKPNDHGRTRCNVRCTLRFGGVAATRSIYNPDHRIANDAIFVSQFGGLCTIMNTGDAEIKAGNWVVWDLPQREGEGEKMCGLHSKQMVITRPYDDKLQGIAGFKAKMAKDNNFKEYVNKAFDDATDDDSRAVALNDIQNHLVETRSRIIGRAMTHAKTHETFDLLLGRYCC